MRISRMLKRAPLDPLLARIRGEYVEMPGLRLTTAQACRLWNMDVSMCQAVLDALVEQKFLIQTREGAFILLTSMRGVARESVETSSDAPRILRTA